MKKWLLILPIISVLQINIQCSMWIFLFIMMLPFLFERKSFSINNIYYENYNKRPLYVSILFMIVTGFLNPYGINAMAYTFKSISYNNLLYIHSKFTGR